MVGAMGWGGPQWRSPGGSCGLVGFPEEVRGRCCLWAVLRQPPTPGSLRVWLLAAQVLCLRWSLLGRGPFPRDRGILCSFPSSTGDPQALGGQGLVPSPGLHQDPLTALFPLWAAVCSADSCPPTSITTGFCVLSRRSRSSPRLSVVCILFPSVHTSGS